MFLDLCCRIVGNTESGESAKKYFSPPWKVSGPAQTPHAQGQLHSHGDSLLASTMPLVFLAVAIAFGFYIQIGSRDLFLSLLKEATLSIPGQRGVLSATAPGLALTPVLPGC